MCLTYMGAPGRLLYIGSLSDRVGGHKGNVGVTKDFLLLRVDFCFVHRVHRIQEKSQATAEGKTLDVISQLLRLNLKVKGT